MPEWLSLEESRQLELLNFVSNKTGLPANAIEKDWWVTLVLKVAFATEWAPHLVFKGGTSLSKSWALIERFSEDIDLAISRDVLGFPGDLSNTKIRALRRASYKFVNNEFREAMEQGLLELGVAPNLFTLTAKPAAESDRDPQVLELNYPSVVEKSDYLRERVLIEVGARSLREPSSQRQIQSIIGVEIPNQPYSGSPFTVETVDPKRTFLEKAFLLHEEFSKPTEHIRHERMSRHLYDLERLMDTAHAQAALEDNILYQSIIEHRRKYTSVRGITYDNHVAQKINFIPPSEVEQAWELDYGSMVDNMIYGDAPNFKGLMLRMEELKNRFRNAYI